MPKFRKPESEVVEEKSEFSGTDREWLELTKIIVSLANTNGGVIRLYDTGAVDSNQFDSARIDDRINEYIEPRIRNIETKFLKSYTKIKVENSPYKPHVFKRDGPYQDPEKPTRQRNAFYKGQVLVRHSSKTEVATRDDYERVFAEKQTELMERLNLVSKLPIDKPVKIEESPEAIPVKVVPESAGGIPVLVKEVPSKGAKIQVTSDPKAPVMRLEEKDMFDKYPFTYRKLTKELSKRYADFKENKDYHSKRRIIVGRRKELSLKRTLNPSNPKSASQVFYSPIIFEEFDKYYTPRKDG